MNLFKILLSAPLAVLATPSAFAITYSAVDDLALVQPCLLYTSRCV